MSLDDDLRDRVLLVGGKVTGVECPACQFRSRDVDLSQHGVTSVTCPECGTTILTEAQMTQLRQADKL